MISFHKLALVNLLREKGLQHLIDTFAIKAKRHNLFKNLILLKYDQLDSPRGNEIVNQCRGIIVDEANNYAVVSYPYNRFYNDGESYANKIDWSTAKVYEKLDGSLCTVYWYNNQWHVATSGTPDASGPLGFDSSQTFKDLFWDTWNKLGYKLPTDRGLCYMFELMTPENIILVRHKDYRIVLHGVREIFPETRLKELPPEGFAYIHQWECVKSHALNNVEDVIKSLHGTDPSQMEGYVVCDANFNRVKIKSPQYVALAHLKEGLTVHRLMDIVRNAEGDEFLIYFPEYKEVFTNLKDKYNILVTLIQKSYDEIPKDLIQKEYASYATKYAWSSLLFMYRAGKIKNLKQGLLEMDIEKLYNIVKGV